MPVEIWDLGVSILYGTLSLLFHRFKDSNPTAIPEIPITWKKCSQLIVVKQDGCGLLSNFYVTTIDYHEASKVILKYYSFKDNSRNTRKNVKYVQS